MPGPADLPVIPAAGTVPWRRRHGCLEVALVHRPRYDDWSWAKGKCDTDEDWPVAAVRETREETGLEVHLGRPLPPASYLVLDKEGDPALKQIRYWAAQVVGGKGLLENEIDEVAWLDVFAASDRLDYARDRDQLRAVVAADTSRQLSTWPLAVVRHAHALSRSSWRGDDQLRPLDKRGRDRAQAIGPLLAAYGVRRLMSSASVRCAQTLQPYAAASGLPVNLKQGLSEEGYAAESPRAGRHLHKLLERGGPAAMCSHGPVMPELLRRLAGLAAEDPAAALEAAAEDGMRKGEVLVCHLVGTGDSTRVATVERHLP